MVVEQERQDGPARAPADAPPGGPDAWAERLRDPDADPSPFLRSAGFDPAGPFCAICVASPDAAVAVRLGEGLVRRGARVAVDRRTNVLLLQDRRTSQVVDLAVGLLDGVPAGVGLATSGPLGARRTFGQALSAGRLASRNGQLVRFETSWPLLLLLRSEDELHDHLAPAMEFARRRQELAQTVRTFAACGFSITATGRAMHLTPNAVVYRLGRWKSGTGWDPRTYEGLTYSLASLELLALEDAHDRRCR